MWAFLGIVLAAIGAVIGTLRGREEPRGFYEGEVYGLTALSHRRFAFASILFAAAFALIGAFPVLPLLFPVLAAYTIFFILYLTSFVRGAVGEDE